MYLMSKEGFADLDTSAFECHEIHGDLGFSIAKKMTFTAKEERLGWLLQNLDKLYGQGLIYCDDEATCKVLAKHLRKNKVMAEAYIEVANLEKRERTNYLTNSFSNGSMPILITTHDIGKNISNPLIRFVVHYDMPSDQQLYALHTSQIGQLGETPIVYDLIVV